MKIGLSQRVLYYKGRAHDCIEHGWYHYLDQHALVCISNNLNQDFSSLANNLDAFIITGGDDSDLRRIVEVKLASAMLKLNKPIVGICHGGFLLTELLGGQVSTVPDHMDTEHTVIYQQQEINVNSYHNLSIEQAPKSSQVLVQDSQGLCEAWIDGKIAAVVWHPERMKEPWLPVEIASLIGV